MCFFNVSGKPWGFKLIFSLGAIGEKAADSHADVRIGQLVNIPGLRNGKFVWVQDRSGYE